MNFQKPRLAPRAKLVLLVALGAEIAWTASPAFAQAANDLDEQIIKALNNGVVDTDRLIDMLLDEGQPGPHLTTNAVTKGLRFRTQTHQVSSGQRSNAGGEVAQVFSTVIDGAGSQLMRLRFTEDSTLGKGSYLRVVSLGDGADQRLDGASLAEWGHWSAIFNGDKVEVQLHAAPGDVASFTIDQIAVDDMDGGDGQVPGDDGGIATLCGSDSRSPSSDSRVGRMSGVNCGSGGGCGGCTGWLVSNGTVLTAGHCSGFAGNLIEFNVPNSNSEGVPVAANPDDQYPVGVTGLLFWNDGDGAVGNDWAVMSVGTNSNTGLRAHLVQGFFHMSPIIPPDGASIRVTGYGLDNTPNGSDPFDCCSTDGDGNCDMWGCNSNSLTQQTSTGPFDELDGTTLRYQTDTMPANSGSPVIREASGYAVGIHTNGGCDSGGGGSNSGTHFSNAQLEDALDQFLGANTIFVDREPVSPFQFGLVLHPYRTMAQVAASAPNNWTVWIVEGNYTAASGNAVVIDRPMTLRAPVGVAVIGQ